MLQLRSQEVAGGGLISEVAIVDCFSQVFIMRHRTDRREPRYEADYQGPIRRDRHARFGAQRHSRPHQFIGHF